MGGVVWCNEIKCKCWLPIDILILNDGRWLIDLKVCNVPWLSRKSLKDPLCRSGTSHTPPDYWCRSICALPMAFMLQRHCTDQLIGFIWKASQIPAVLLTKTFVIEEFILMLLALILVSIMVPSLAKTLYYLSYKWSLILSYTLILDISAALVYTF